MTQPGFGAVLRQLLPVAIPGPASGALERILGFRQAEEIYQDLLTKVDGRPLPEKLLNHLEVAYRVSERDLDRIPRKGPAVVVSNHPFGLLDGAILASVLLRLRTDVKFLANRMLAAIPEIRDLLIPVDTMAAADSARVNGRRLKQAFDFLTSGGLLAVFPAGEVAHFQWKQRATADPVWKPAVTRIIAIASRRVKNLSVIPAYVGGSNSLIFQALGLVHPRLRTAWLVRELLNKRQRHIELRIGQPVPVERLVAIPSDEERTGYLRWRAHLLAHRNQFKPRSGLPLGGRTSTGAMLPIAAPLPVESLVREVKGLSPLLRSGEFAVYLSPAETIPALLEEIGRLRELAFRAAGEGTGKSCDLDSFDRYYLHLFLWNADKCEVVGAYRLGPVDLIERQFGVRGLYTATLFRYGPEFLDRLGPALELGRSFIRLEYQRALAPLLLLWKGIGRFITQNPRYKILFGPVSISNQYQAISRQLMVSFLQRRESLSEWAALVSSRNPFRPRVPLVPEPASAGLDFEDLSAAVADIEPGQPGVPVLLRQYLKLGGKLLGFNVDPEFAGALDGLILVDLTRTEPKLLERYLGRAEAAQFLAFHSGG